MSKIREYQGDGVVVRFDGARCIHAARCVDGLRPVFQPGRRPWIDATQAGADEIADVVRQCPSGALTYERSDGVPQEAPPETTTVRVQPDGPLFVTGRIQLVDAEGESGAEQSRVALCRCGASKNKPFCDNSHKTSGFKG